MKETDIRINLLKELSKMGKGTSEFIANEYLRTLHPDLGTIKRMLIELMDEGYIRESNFELNDSSGSIIKNIDTVCNNNNPNKESIKSSNRLTNNINGISKIKSIRIFITLKGINFLIENEKLKNDSLLSKWQKVWFWPIAGIAVISVLLSIIALILSRN